MVAKIFIDGEAGTTGLQIRERLEARRDLQILTIDPARRKDLRARQDYLNAADVVVLCLPDDSAREAVGLIENPQVRVIDASTAHRTVSGWVYGFPEMARAQREAIADSSRVANPGCWATGFIALARPLVANGIIPASWGLTVNGVSGYSGGGKSMIAEFENEATEAPPFRLYALGMGHKHLPEMKIFAGLTQPPLFSPAVGRFYKGMIVEIPLPLYALAGAPGLAEVHASLTEAYADDYFVEVASLEESRAMTSVAPEILNGSNRMRLYAFGSDRDGQCRLVAVFDNLGKGASGAAVQNLNLMLGVDEQLGL